MPGLPAVAGKLPVHVAFDGGTERRRVLKFGAMLARRLPERRGRPAIDGFTITSPHLPVRRVRLGNVLKRTPPRINSIPTASKAATIAMSVRP